MSNTPHKSMRTGPRWLTCQGVSRFQKATADSAENPAPKSRQSYRSRRVAVIPCPVFIHSLDKCEKMHALRLNRQQTCSLLDMISALQKAYPRLAALLNPKSNDSAAETPQSDSQPAFQKAPSGSWSTSQAVLSRQPSAAEQENQRTVKQFFEVAPERVTEIRSLFAQFSAAAPAARAGILGSLSSQVRVLRSICDAPGLEPVSRVTAAFERLLKRMADQPSCLTPSSLRTTASTIVLLETLSKPGFQCDLLSSPAPRLLSIDDDPVCRKAISSAIEQAFNSPDHAENGEGALALVESQSYDIIFLDVEMPGMNGFEVCTRIHQTKRNAHTPVVFVTVHSDFESRAKASESSGHDLLAKPFQPAELTLKALTVLIRRRMQSGVPNAARGT